jgi:hypothetical protein
MRPLFIINAGKRDPIVTSYITRAGITNYTEIKAVDIFVLGLRTYGLLPKAKAIWPCSPTSIGASYISHFGFAQCRLWQRHLAGLVCGWRGNGLCDWEGKRPRNQHFCYNVNHLS